MPDKVKLGLTEDGGTEDVSLHNLLKPGMPPHHPTIAMPIAVADRTRRHSRYKEALRPLTFHAVTMEHDTFTATQYNTSDPASFAHTSARERWPIILTQGIDDVHKSTWASSDEETVKEGKQVVSELAKLKYELQHNRDMQPIPDDGEADVDAYNQELAARGGLKWHSAPWLYAECHLYRYVLFVSYMEDSRH